LTPFFVRAKKVRQSAAPTFTVEQGKTANFIHREAFARLTALNSSSQTKIKNQILFLRFSLKEKRIKHHFHIRGTA